MGYEAANPKIRQGTIFGQKKLWNRKKEKKEFAATASDFGVTKLFAHDEREDSDNEVMPGKQEKEIFGI